MRASYYDAIVVGTALPAHACGAILSKRGFRVLLVGQDRPAPSYRVGDLTLPRAPFSFLAAHSPVARRVLGELALYQTFRRHAVAMDPAFQVALPGHRLDLPLEESDLEREIERELPEVKRPAEDFLRNVDSASAHFDGMVERDLMWPPETFFERREVARAAAHLPFDRDGGGSDLLAELPEEHPFRHVVSAPVRFADGMDPERLNALQRARLFTAWRRGAAALEGGMETLTAMLLERIETQGGELRLDDRVERIVLERRHVAGVRLTASDEEMGAGHVLFGGGVYDMLRLLPDRRTYEEVFERLGEPQLRHYRFTLNVLLAAEGVPVGMARDVFFLRDPSRPPWAENLLHVEAHPADEQGRRLLCVEALVPRRGVEDVGGYIETFRERLLGSLGELVPFLGKHVLVVDSPHDGRPPQDMMEGRELVPDQPWSRGPATMRPLYGYPVTSALGVCALPVRTPVKRLLLCNDQVVPGLGQEGELLAAWSAARVVTKSDRKRALIRRGRWAKVEI